MELAHEQFQGAKELAEIGKKISEGIAALSTLKKNEETYIAEREERLVARLKGALSESEDLIKAIGTNHDALVGYKNLVADFYDRVLSLLQRVDDFMQLLDDTAGDLEGRIATHERKVEEFNKETMLTRSALAAHANELAVWERGLIVKEHKLNDIEARLERTVKRIKK